MSESGELVETEGYKGKCGVEELRLEAVKQQAAVPQFYYTSLAPSNSLQLLFLVSHKGNNSRFRDEIHHPLCKAII